jgi:acetolactate synthase-1/2/3 large subunit
MPTVAEHVVSRLREAGVRMLFGVPGGGGNLDLIEAAGRIGLPFVLTATETAGALAAMAQAEVTGQPGACLTTLGPGAASVVNGVACAWLDRAPIFVFTDCPAGESGTRTSRFEHQQIDQGALFSSFTKLSRTLTPDAAVQAIIELACGIVTKDRPGPVHLNWPGDLGSKQGSDVDLDRLFDEFGSAGIEKLWESSGPSMEALIPKARKPLLLVGLGARGPADARAIRDFCDRRGIPGMVTYKAKGVIPDDHTWFAGVFTNGGIERPIIDESDLLIGIGLDPVELLPRRWAHRQPIVYLGPWPAPSNHVPFGDQLVADVPSALAQIDTLFSPTDWNSAHVRQLVNDQRQAISIPAPGMTAQRVVEMAGAHFAAESRVTVDAGAHMFPATMLWPVSEPNQMLISNGLSTMGFALPAAIGAALADRERPVVALTGDGGLLMCVGELLTAAREGLRIIVIVFNDASLSLIEIKQQARKLTPAGVALGSIDWGTLAASFGVTPFTATNETELQWALDRAGECDGPSLIDARIDRSNYGAVLRAVRG